MPTKYLVLRSKKPIKSFKAADPETWHRAPDDLSLQIYDGRESDEGSLRADKHSVAVMDADVIFQLIEPKSRVATADPATLPLRKVGVQRMTDGLVAIRAHASPFTGQGVTVAVLDTGLDVSHPAFKNMELATCNFTNDGEPNDVRDENGHGTHCAGTVCGRVVDDVRIGVAPGVTKLCAGKVLGTHGGTLEMLLEGMIWAVLKQKAMVVSMSLGYDLPGNAQRLIRRGMPEALATAAAMRQQADIIKGISTLRAFLESQSQSVVFVAATGNESERPSTILPASLPASELFSVGAVGLAGDGRWKVAIFSNGRAQVVAPGVDVVSAAVGGGWTVMSGTSMATPHVAGVAALCVEKLRNEGNLHLPGAVRHMLMANAIRLPVVDPDIDATGWGMVQAPT